MNLDFGNKYDEFRKEVKAFCKEYEGIHVTSNLYSYESVVDPNVKPKIEMSVKEWQKILIKKDIMPDIFRMNTEDSVANSTL